MIDLSNKSLCCGCGACVQRCPKSCIHLVLDEEGFLYPNINLDNCINCGLCEKVCSFNNFPKSQLPLSVYAAYNLNSNIRKRSSSGGIFYALAENVIKQGGVVFGAKYTESFKVIHDFVDNLDDLPTLIGSKYAQSEIGNAYRIVESFLKSQRMVLFSGTPCQISGLHNFLRKKYPNLIAVDIVCHGVPSPLILQEYLTYEKQRYSNACLKSLNFRDKTFGWLDYGVKITFVNSRQRELYNYTKHLQNIYMRGFLSDVFLRPSCYDCKVKNFSSGSDITLGDFWGIEQVLSKEELKDGISLVVINTQKGTEILSQLNLKLLSATLNDALSGNPALVTSAERPKDRSYFWNNYLQNHIPFLKVYLKKKKLSFIRRLFRKILSYYK